MIFKQHFTVIKNGLSNECGELLEVGGTHYQKPIQVWDFVFANKIPFDEASAIKYLCRHNEKKMVLRILRKL